jgi:hypothetical protein
MKLKNISAYVALAFGLATAPQARADTWGCEVLLCLSNPAGPMAVAQCVPPITRLYRAIFKWRPDPFPTCTMSNGSDSSSGGNYAYVAPPSFYDACPSGTTAVGAGTYAAVGRALTPVELAAQPRWNPQSFIMTSGFVAGSGEGSGYFPSYENTMPTKVCGGNYLGQTTQTTGTSWDDQTTITVNIYDRVVLIDPAADSFNINVMINSSLFRNIRPFSQGTARNL